MKKSSAFAGSVAAAILVIAAAMLFRRPAEKPAAPSAKAPATQSERTDTAPVLPAPEPKPVVVTGPEEVAPDVVRLRANNILATVNGVAVQGSDLLVFGSAAEPEQALAPEIYDALLQRAIERELIVQAARSGGVDVLPDQENQLDQVRKTVLAREGGDPNAKYMNVQGTLQEQLDFELRDAKAMLLRNTLLEQRGHSLPYVTAEQVKAAYDADPAKYGVLPEDPAERDAAWQKIDFQIRTELTPQLQTDYQAQVESFMQELKQGANIATTPST